MINLKRFVFMYFISCFSLSLSALNVADYFDDKDIMRIYFYSNDDLTGIWKYQQKNDKLQIIDVNNARDTEMKVQDIMFSEDLIVKRIIYDYKGDISHVIDYIYDENLLLRKIIKNVEYGFIEEYTYEYNDIGNILTDSSENIQRFYFYNNEDRLIKIKTKSRNNAETIQNINYYDNKAVISPYYRPQIIADKLESKKNGDSMNFTIIETIYIGDKVIEIREFIFKNNRISEITIDNKYTIDSSITLDKLRYIFEYN